MTVNIAELAKKIARGIMSEGDIPTKCQRIQFMGGTWPDNEKPQGGMCEAALVRCIEQSLTEAFTPHPEPSKEK